MIEPGSATLRNAIHLWSANLNQVEDASEAILDEQERHRAARYRMPDKRRHFVKSRYLMRRIVSRYVGEQAGSIRIAYHDKGKPYLPDHHLHFSISHSHDRWIIALSADTEIGVDIEKIEPRGGMEAIIRSYFHQDEQEKFSHMDPQQRLEAFYRHWTQMEAFVKLHRIGLHARMNTIRQQERGLRFDGEPDSYVNCESYRMYPAYIVSIATRGARPVMRMNWQDTESSNWGREE